MTTAEEFEVLTNDIIDAGFSGSRPYFVLFDADGLPWKKMPEEMNAEDIFEYVEDRFGPMFVRFLKKRWQLKVH